MNKIVGIRREAIIGLFGIYGRGIMKLNFQGLILLDGSL